MVLSLHLRRASGWGMGKFAKFWILGLSLAAGAFAAGEKRQPPARLRELTGDARPDPLACRSDDRDFLSRHSVLLYLTLARCLFCSYAL